MPRIVFLEPAMRVSTWRTMWPARELVRRGYDAVAAAQDVRRQVEVFGNDTIVLHITAGAWMESDTEIATPFSTVRRFLDLVQPHGGRLFVSFSDDLTQLYHVQTATPHLPITEGNDYADASGITLRLRLFIADLPVICREVAGVIVTTPRLAEVYGKWAQRIHVAEAYLPRALFAVPHGKGNGRLGWMGTLEVHHRDLELIRPWARDLPPMHMIGAGRAGADLLRSWGARDVTWTPPLFDQRALYAEMGRCRAAIVPLVTEGKLGRFNAGKSWIKPMEFLAQGVPTVASAFREYDRLPLPTFRDPEALVAAAWGKWRMAPHAGPLDESWSMEGRGGDQWESALTFV